MCTKEHCNHDLKSEWKGKKPEIISWLCLATDQLINYQDLLVILIKSNFKELQVLRISQLSPSIYKSWENIVFSCLCCLIQPVLKRCLIEQLTGFTPEKDTLGHLSTGCRKVQVQKGELPFKTDHKVPFSERQLDLFFTGAGTGYGFGTNEGMRQANTSLLSAECHLCLCCDWALLL